MTQPEHSSTSSEKHVPDEPDNAGTHGHSEKGMTPSDLAWRILDNAKPWKAEFWHGIWKVCKPLQMPTIMLLVLINVAYVGTRKYVGVDVLAGLASGVREPNVPSAQEPSVPSLSGLWEYRCVANDGLTFDHGGDEHGGTVLIHQTSVSSVPSFSVTGTRMWTKTEANLTTLKRGTPWDSKDGSFVTNERIQFPYEATSKGTSRLRGWVQATIELSDGKPDKMTGTFYYIKEDDKAILGTVEFRKIKDTGDRQWGTGS